MEPVFLLLLEYYYFIIIPQISKAIAGADRKELMRKLPKFIYDEEKALEVSSYLLLIPSIMLILKRGLAICLEAITAL